MSWASVISGGASIIGGLLGSASADKATDASIANNAANIALQQDFAKKGIRWRVKDAEAAGIHPLYSMGASLPTFQPSPLNIGADNSMGTALAQAGQDIGRAVSATATQPERDLALQRAGLQNKLLEAQILKLTRESQTGPPLPSATTGSGGIPGQGNFPTGVDVFPREITASSPANLGRQAGAPAGISYVMGSDQKLRIYPSTDTKELMEDNPLLELKWAYQNMAKPLWTRQDMRDNAPSTKEFPLPQGFHWQWNGYCQCYEKTPNSHRRNIGPSARSRNLYRPDRSLSGGGW